MSRWDRWFGSDSNGYQELGSSSQSSQRATTVPNKTKQVQVKEISAEEAKIAVAKDRLASAGTGWGFELFGKKPESKSISTEKTSLLDGMSQHLLGPKK
ncbi:MAG TPA: hypothetical protein VJL60_05530 [Gammaproteobacteria bacterium]|nr:hypothetical protein [Gammaproteobacteria bacterium]